MNVNTEGYLGYWVCDCGATNYRYDDEGPIQESYCGRCGEFNDGQKLIKDTASEDGGSNE